MLFNFFFFFQAEDGIRDRNVTGVQRCALPILVLGKTDTPLGAFYRRKRAQLGAPKAIKLGRAPGRERVGHGGTDGVAEEEEREGGWPVREAHSLVWYTLSVL